jgi:hypothetical protein
MNGRYMMARRLAGGVLHSIQDFYAHTNYVEILRVPAFEGRLGTSLGSFAVGKPSIALETDPTCLKGERLFTDLTPEEQAEVVRFRPNPAALLQRLRTDPPLTSGYFYVWDLYTPAPLNDESEVADTQKCRHGYKLPLGPYAPYPQPGINKDDPTRRGHESAKSLATGHSANYIVSLFNDRTLRARPDFIDMMLGFMGHGTQIVDLQSFVVGVPGAPNGDSWDTAIGGLPRVFLEGIRGLKNIQPDISVCVESANLPGTCAPICDDADWSLETKPQAYICRQALGVRTESNLRVLVREADLGIPRRVIADVRIEDATKCNESYTAKSVAGTTVNSATGGDLPVARPDEGACRLQLDADRQIWIQLTTQPATAPLPAGPRLPPPAPNGTAPGPTAPAPVTLTGLGSGTSAPQLASVQVPVIPVLPPAPPLSPPLPDPPPRTGPAPTSPTPTSPTPTAPAPVTTLSAPTAPAPTVPATAPALGGAATPRLPTAAEIDAILNLRDANACTGSDAFVPPGTAFVDSPLGQQLGPARAAQLYQMAAFAMAIADPAVKAKVLSAIQSRVGDDAFFGAMTQVIGDVQQSRALVAAYQALAQNVVSRITATGLDRLLTPPRAAVADVGTWILKMLTSDALVSDAVGMMAAGPSGLSAECALNELAKNGFAATIGAR